MLRRVCICKQEFTVSRTWTSHLSTCPAAIADSTETLWDHRERTLAKRRRVEEDRQVASGSRTTAVDNVPNPSTSHSTEDANDIPLADTAWTPAPVIEALSSAGEAGLDTSEDDDIPLGTRRPRRVIKLPKRYDDFDRGKPKKVKKTTDVPPAAQAGLPPAEFLNNVVPQVSLDGALSDQTGGKRGIDSPKNCFGLFRRYFSSEFPTHDPDASVDPKSLVENDGRDSARRPISELSTDTTTSSPHSHVGPTSVDPSSANPYSPFPNQSAFLLRKWQANGARLKSDAQLNKLVDLLTGEKIVASELRGVNFTKIKESLATGPEATQAERTTGTQSSGEHSTSIPSPWTCTPVTISVPCHSRMDDPGAKDYELRPGFYHRNLVSVIKERVGDPAHFTQFHTEPYELYSQPNPSAPPDRVHGELYTSEAFLTAHRDLQEGPSEPGCSLEKVVVGCMFGSDLTHLTQFGEHKLWPLYMGFANESKYLRTKPSTKKVEVVAFFEQVQNTI